MIETWEKKYGDIEELKGIVVVDEIKLRKIKRSFDHKFQKFKCQWGKCPTPDKEHMIAEMCRFEDLVFCTDYCMAAYLNR